jgi:hypothetical protein
MHVNDPGRDEVFPFFCRPSNFIKPLVSQKIKSSNMKKLLVLIGFAVFVTSCNNGNSPMMNNGMDSVAAAYAANM